MGARCTSSGTHSIISHRRITKTRATTRRISSRDRRHPPYHNTTRRSHSNRHHTSRSSRSLIQSITTQGLRSNRRNRSVKSSRSRINSHGPRSQNRVLPRQNFTHTITTSLKSKILNRSMSTSSCRRSTTSRTRRHIMLLSLNLRRQVRRRHHRNRRDINTNSTRAQCSPQATTFQRHTLSTRRNCKTSNSQYNSARTSTTRRGIRGFGSRFHLLQDFR